MLQIKDVTFSFNGKDPFFKNLSLHLDHHQLYFIQGKNGVGKSTFFRILRADTRNNESLSGSMIIDNQSIIFNHSHNVSSMTKQIKLVDQNINSMVADQLTVAENLQIASLTRYPFLQKLPLLHKDVLLEKFDIDYYKPVYALSGGQKQIVALAMTIQKPTRILLLDEPTAALDTQNTHIVLQYLCELALFHKIMVLIITHDKELVSTYARNGYLEMQENTDGTRTIQLITRSHQGNK